MTKVGSLGTIATKTFSIATFLKKYWYWVTLLLILVPAFISAVQTSLADRNPAYPFLLVGSKILLADSLLHKQVDLLQTNPEALVGMAKPTEGIWRAAVYYWKFFFNAIWEITSNVWLIFFPLVFTYNLLRLRNTSEPLKTSLMALGIFVIYLFVVNAVILAHGLAVGNTFVTLPSEQNEFRQYLTVLIYLLPFHGLGSLVMYLIGVFGAESL